MIISGSDPILDSISKAYKKLSEATGALMVVRAEAGTS